jgi:hypothetical protein
MFYFNLFIKYSKLFLKITKSAILKVTLFIIKYLSIKIYQKQDFERYQIIFKYKFIFVAKIHCCYRTSSPKKIFILKYQKS